MMWVWIAAKALFGGLGHILGAVWTWVTASTVHLLAAALIGMALWNVVLHRDLTQCHANTAKVVTALHAKDQADQEATRVAAAHVQDVQAEDQRIAQEHQNALQDRLASAHAAAQRVPHIVYTSTTVSGPTDAATGAAAAPGSTDMAVVAPVDVDNCATDWVIATGWQDWWKDVTAARAVTR